MTYIFSLSHLIFMKILKIYAVVFFSDREAKMWERNILPKGAQPVNVGNLPDSTFSFLEIPLIPIRIGKAIWTRGKFFWCNL